MSKWVLSLSIILIMTLLLASCVRTASQKPPLLLQQAERHNLTGVDAEAKQKFASAEYEFTEAYRLFSAVENYPGMVTALINSSRLYRRQQNLAKTENVLKNATRLVPNVPELESEISFEKSKLELLKGNAEGALQWGDIALLTAKDIDRARMLNLIARIQLLRGRVRQARDSAEAALKSAINYKERREEANAIRLLGEIAFLEKRYNDSIQLYESVLTIDKGLAIPSRVFADLTALSVVAEAKGETPKAAEYLQRAVDAALGDNNIKGAEVDLERLEKLYLKSGENQAAEDVNKRKKSLIEVKPEK
jgi:tetratricopeptide (TPR) repeat protein